MATPTSTKQEWGSGSLYDRTIVEECKIVSLDTTKDVTHLACWDTNPDVVAYIVSQEKRDVDVVYTPTLKVWAAFDKPIVRGAG